ncbi:MAG: NAD(P)H-dependent oxidoreductase subunit E [Bacteroidetes bacterium]|nr:MAG: NAD(P)H-dependent oxidoreductase subunit E [Bacteroidota bacterium]
MTPEEIISQHARTQDNLLNILHDLQNNHPEQHITREAMDLVARYLNMTKSSVYGVVDYYSMLSLKPRGKFIIRVCISPVCHIKKAGTILVYLEKELGIKSGETTPDKLFTLEVAECLGQCQEAPSMMINEKVFNNLTEERIKEIIAQYK